jgi:hypothetical protein
VKLGDAETNDSAPLVVPRAPAALGFETGFVRLLDAVFDALFDLFAVFFAAMLASLFRGR